MRWRYRLLHLLARGVCLVRGHRYLYGRSDFGGVTILTVRCRRCQKCAQKALPSMHHNCRSQAVPLAKELPSA